MDRHDVSAEVTAEIVAQLHREDLKIQDKFDCKALTYWFDDIRKTAFCLVEAPNKEAIQEMHDCAHGQVAHRIIEVDGAVVESFLGRIEDPEKSKNTTLNIINDPAFRTIMVLTMKPIRLLEPVKTQKKDYQNLIDSIQPFLQTHKGRMAKQQLYYVLVSFDSVTHAVQCALEIQNNIEKECKQLIFKIGLSAGVPVSEKEGIFEDTIKMAERLSVFGNSPISISSNVKNLYESENLNTPLNNKAVYQLSTKDENFLNQLVDFTERVWHRSTLSATDFCKDLGYSKSQLYRKMMAVIGKSPNTFIKDYRLDHGLRSLQKQGDNISEIAYKTGFNSAAYFSKCFMEKYGILPSQYIKHFTSQ